MTDAVTRIWHPDDGTLMRHVDRECDAEERAALESHLRSCATCRGRAQTFADLAGTVDTLLGEEPPAADVPRRTRRPILRAALVILACGVAAASATPLRRWITARIGSAPPAAAAPTPIPAVEPLTPRRAAVSFVPAGTRVELRFVARQITGDLVLTASADSTMTFGATADASTPAIEVLPAGIVVQNAPEDRLSYRVSVPASARDILVRIGGDAAREIAWHRLDDLGSLHISVGRTP